MGTIIIKTEGSGDTASTEPSTLTKGELAVNTQGGLLFHGNSSGATARFKATTLAGTDYSLFTVSGGKVVEIGAGTNGYVLTSTGTGSIPAWEAAAGGGVSLGSTSSTAHRGDHGVSAYNGGVTRYTHPTSYAGDDISVDTGALTGATIISDLDFNITTDTSGHVSDANGEVSTRTLTLADLGYTGATDANNYSLPSTVIHESELSSSTSSTSATTAANSAAVKAAYDRGSTGVTNAASAQTTANAALPKSGGAMTGAITTNSTFDGRDVATDGAKLDGIEASATADQTDAEIRAAVEAASDSNVFTDADHSKLNGIASGADDFGQWNLSAASSTSGVGSTDTVTFAAGAGIGVAKSGNTVTYSATGGGGSAADDITAGDADVTLTTTSGDVIIESPSSVEIQTADTTVMKFDSSQNPTGGHVTPFIVTAGITKLGTSDVERHVSFTTTSGNSGTALLNHYFLCPGETKLHNVFFACTGDISGDSSFFFRLRKASNQSTSLSDIYKITNPSLPAEMGGQNYLTFSGMSTAGTMIDLLNPPDEFNGAMGTDAVTDGAHGVQSFSLGDKIFGGMDFNGTDDIRGTFTFVMSYVVG